MPMWWRRTATLFVFVLVPLTVGAVEEQRVRTSKALLIGITQAPPFVIKNGDGTWGGISIELWRAIADRLQLSYQLQEFDLQHLLLGLQNGSLDVAVAALAITAEREKVVDFTYPYYTTGLGIAIARKRAVDWLSVARHLFSLRMVQLFSALALGMFISGVVMWVCEKRANPGHFGEPGIRGLWAGIWWAAVTHTGVGYGDKIPVTVVGRVIAVLWMFASIIMLTVFTAALTAILTVEHLSTRIHEPQDLTRVSVATVVGSTSEAYLRRNHIAYRDYSTLSGGLLAVVAGEVDAIVYDVPLLRHFAHTQMKGEVEVLPTTFEFEAYAMALPAGSPLREPVNRALLETIEQPAWWDTLSRYLGR
jgi:polar amino acid transport system substrate-binding protein